MLTKSNLNLRKLKIMNVSNFIEKELINLRFSDYFKKIYVKVFTKSVPPTLPFLLDLVGT